MVESASHHLVIEWAPPKVPNGIIKGYVVKYGPKSTGWAVRMFMMTFKTSFAT